jgi:formate hydrogenlyase subunit 3/multisubunit Na+/H+ antiporter MnhD subunit
MIQQQQRKPKRKAVRRTVMEWIMLVFNLIPALLLMPVFQSLVHPPKALTLITTGVLLGTLGFWGASISLLARTRKVAAIFELLAAIGWWCAAVWLIQHSQNPLAPRSWPFLSGLVLIGLFLTWLASWLWRFQDDAEEAR